MAYLNYDLIKAQEFSYLKVNGNSPLTSEASVHKHKQHILYIADSSEVIDLFKHFETVRQLTANEVEAHLKTVSNKDEPDAILYASEHDDKLFYENLVSISYQLKERGFNTPIIIINDKSDKVFKKKILKFGADDCISAAFNPIKLNYCIDFLKVFKKLTEEQETAHEQSAQVKISFSKRLFDILVSGLLLVLSSPILLFVALIIKLESKGSVFYVSKRAGMGYKVFNFLKFRSMSSGADKELSKLLHLNQYSGGVEVKDKTEANPVFFKIKNDPRITRFGKFLRDTSIDELPQLINVLRGDMSIVGNRPLPLYEAQQLTKDQAALRFMAPAGITGLWQVTKRGKAEMSEDERIALDISYAKNNSFRYDIKLLLKTIPALFQEEAV